MEDEDRFARGGAIAAALGAFEADQSIDEGAFSRSRPSEGRDDEGSLKATAKFARATEDLVQLRLRLAERFPGGRLGGPRAEMAQQFVDLSELFGSVVGIGAGHLGLFESSK